MHNHYRVTTLDYLIENIKIKMNNPDYDNLYLKRLKEFLEYYIKEKYGNIRTVAAISLIGKPHRIGNNEIFEYSQWGK